MIPSSALLDYGAVLHRAPDGVWRGRADNVSPPSHSGLLGPEPIVELSGGTLRLQRTRKDDSPSPAPSRFPRPPIQHASLPVGTLDAVLNDGDRLLVWSGPTADVGLMLVRDDARIAGFGAVTRCFTPAIRATEDPRVFEEHLYYVKRLLDDSATTFVWLHVADPDLDGIVERFPDMAPGGRLAVAIAGGDRAARRELNRRINERRRRPKVSSAAFFDVDERFDTEDQWRTYINGLPSRRPDDLYVRFTIEGVELDVREGEYREHPPWQFHVHNVYRDGIPGEMSHVAIVQASLGLTRDAIVEAAKQIAGQRIALRP